MITIQNIVEEALGKFQTDTCTDSEKKKLVVSFKALGDVSAADIIQFSQLLLEASTTLSSRTILWLSFRECTLQEECQTKLQEFLQYTTFRVESLDVSETTLEYDQVASLVQAAARSLRIFGMTMHNQREDLEGIVRIFSPLGPCLESLTLHSLGEHKEIGDRLMEVIVQQLGQLPQLKEFCFERYNCTDAAMRLLLQAVRQLSNHLQRFAFGGEGDLATAPLSLPEFTHLFEIMPNTCSIHFYLQDCPFFFAGAEDRDFQSYLTALQEGQARFSFFALRKVGLSPEQVVQLLLAVEEFRGDGDDLFVWIQEDYLFSQKAILDQLLKSLPRMKEVKLFWLEENDGEWLGHDNPASQKAKNAFENALVQAVHKNTMIEDLSLMSVRGSFDLEETTKQKVKAICSRNKMLTAVHNMLQPHPSSKTDSDRRARDQAKLGFPQSLLAKALAKAGANAKDYHADPIYYMLRNKLIEQA